MNAQKFLLGSTVCLLASAAMADAGAYRTVAVYDTAQVLSSQPVIRYVTVTTPERECWQDTQTYTVNQRVPGSGASTLLGAIIGGVVGHQIGSGRGNDAATAAGAMIGAVVGNQNAQQRYAGPVGATEYSRPIERCTTRNSQHQEQRIDGYNVVYRYHGQKYSTQMPYDPGRTIRVRVDVRPAG